MNKFWKCTGFILFFAAGLLIVLYPTLSSKWNERRFQELVTEYDVNAADESRDFSDEIKKVQDYNAILKGSEVPDAFSIRENVADPKYEELMNINNNGIMGSIEIPVIDVKLPIYHYTRDEVLEKGVGHLFGSSLPVGGESTHCVLSAHRGLPNAKMFTDLDLLREGDVFYLKVFNDTLAYEVDQILKVEPQETSSLAIEEGKDYVTLVTCTPYAVNTHRLLVRGHRIPYEEEVYREAAEHSEPRFGSSLWIHVLCALAGVVLAVFMCWLLPGILKKRQDKNHGSAA